MTMERGVPVGGETDEFRLVLAMLSTDASGDRCLTRGRRGPEPPGRKDSPKLAGRFEVPVRWHRVERPDPLWAPGPSEEGLALPVADRGLVGPDKKIAITAPAMVSVRSSQITLAPRSHGSIREGRGLDHLWDIHAGAHEPNS